MGNKIITEKDFWICSGGTTPAQLQSRQTPQLVKKDSGHKYITVADTATSSWIDFGCKKLMWIMAILAAVIVVAVVATGGAALGALIAAGAIAGAAGAAFGAVVGALICGQKAAAAREWLSSKPDMIIKGQRAITGDDKMKCKIFGATITFAPNIKNWWQAIALGASNYIGGILEGMMYGAAIGAAGGIISGGPAVLGEFGVSNLGANWLATWGGWGLGLRGAVTAQSVLGAYGETGQVTAGDVLYHGVFGMETGTLESAKNIVTGNGTMDDVIGVALWFTPAHARNQKSRTTTEEGKSEEGKNEEGKNEENPQARTGESKTKGQQGEFEAYEEGKDTKPPKEEPPPESHPVCFVAGTLVQTPNGPIPIEALERGQLVLAKGEGQSIDAYRVLDYKHGMTRTLYHIEVGGSYQCTTTRNHPFFVAGKGWTNAHKIEIGDGLMALDGAIVPVTAIDRERLIDPVDTFNIHVEDVSTYFVGGGLAVWVHNADPPPGDPVYNDRLYWGFGASGPRQRVPDPNNPDMKPDYDGASSWASDSPDEVGRFMGVRAAEGKVKANHGAVSSQQLTDQGLVAVETPGNYPALEAAGLKHYSIRPATNPDPDVPLTEEEMRFVDQKLKELKVAAKGKPNDFGCG